MDILRKELPLYSHLSITKDLTKIEDLNVVLHQGIREGFLRNEGSDWYSFVHDQVQSAALTLHDEETMRRLKYQVGVALLRSLLGN